MKNLWLCFLMASVLALRAQAPVPNFALRNVADNGVISLESQTASAIVIIFTSNACAYDEFYRDRIKTLIGQYQNKVPFWLINAHPDPEETPDNMKAAYAGWGVSAPYFADKDQLAMDILGARRSPEVFLLKKSGGKYVVAYHGALDDNPQVAADVKENYLQNAIEQVMAGKPVAQQTIRPVGCSIRKK